METEIERLRKKAQAFEDTAASLESSVHQYRKDAAKARTALAKLEAEAAAAAKTYGQREAEKMIPPREWDDFVHFRPTVPDECHLSEFTLRSGVKSTPDVMRRTIAAAIDAGRKNGIDACVAKVKEWADGRLKNHPDNYTRGYSDCLENVAEQLARSVTP